MAAVSVTATKAISMLRSAIVNARIYPKGSQMIESSLTGAHQALETCLKESSPLVVSDIQGKLCINGKEAPQARDFRPFLVQHDVQSLKILSGLQISELASLLEVLGSRKAEMGDCKTLSEWLVAHACTHLQAETVEFIEVKKGDVLIQHVLQLLDESASDAQTLIGSLEESFQMIEHLPDESGRRDVQNKMAAHLSGLPPQQLREIFDAKLPERIEKSRLRDDVVRVMSRDKLEETLEEVNKWYQHIRRETASEFEVVEKLNSLKSFLGKILHSPASKTVPFALYEELLNVGLLSDVPAGVTKGEAPSLLSEVEAVLNLPVGDLLEPAMRQRLPELLKALCGMALEEPIQKLTDQVLENLSNPAPVVREKAAKLVCVFEEILAANRKDKPFMRVVGRLHQLCESETSPEVYGQYVVGLRIGAMELLVNWRFEESAMLLAVLRRHSREESPIGQKKKNLAAQALHDFSLRGLDVLCADLNASLKDRQNGSYRVLAELGDEAVAPLVESIKRSNDPRSRQAAIQAMRRLGPSVQPTLLKHMNIGISAEILVKLIPVLEDVADATILPTLATLLQHPDGSVRRTIAQLLSKIDEPRAQALLTSLLQDGDPDVQSEAVRIIGNLRLRTAVPAMASRLAGASPAVQEEMCIALGHLGDQQAIPDLISLLQDRGAFWKKNAGTSEAVRLRAAWALGMLLPNDSARRALTKLLKDPNANIQRAAQNALSRKSTTSRPLGQAA